MFYHLIDHTADIGFEATGASDSELFANAALAMFDLLTDTEKVSIRDTKLLAVQGIDRVDLIINFLREALYLYNGDGFLVKSVRVAEISEDYIVAEASGENYDPDRHTIKTELKAVTYHQADVRLEGGIWKARVIFDV
jgi:SHS2 domain-containing protein